MRMFSTIRNRLGDFWWYSALIFLAARAGDLINAFIGLWLVPRYVAAEDLGAVLPLVQISIAIGAPLTVLVTVFSRFLTKFRTRGERGRVKSMLRWFLGLSLALFAIVLPVSWWLLPNFFARIRLEKGSLAILILATGFVTTLAPMFVNALQGLEKFNALAAINFISAPVRLVVMLVAMPFRAVSGYMLGQAAAPFAQMVASCVALRHEMFARVPSVPFWRGEGRELARFSICATAWILPGAVVPTILFTLLRQYLPAEDSAGYYVISRFSELATYAGVSLAYVIFPVAAHRHARGGEARALMHRACGLAFAFGLLCTLGCLLLGGPVLRALPIWRASARFVPEMALLSLGMTMGVVGTVYCNFESASNRFGFLKILLSVCSIQTFAALAFCAPARFAGWLPPVCVDWLMAHRIADLRAMCWLMFAGSFFTLLGFLPGIFRRRTQTA